MFLVGADTIRLREDRFMFSDVLLTVDFDRTLTAPDSTIPKRNIEAIEYFIANGGTFTINSGRSIPMCANNVIPIVPVNAPLLLYNGSAAYDVKTGKLTRYAPIELDQAEMIRDLQSRFPRLHIEIQGLDAHYLTRRDAGWENYCESCHCAWGYVSPDNIPQPFIKAAINGPFRDGTVAEMYKTDAQEQAIFQNAIDYIDAVYGHTLQTFRACPRIVDIHALGVSKLNSARLLQQELGKKILVCVGDAENDIAMLDGADYAFCPADGIIADRYENVCPCANGAVADVIYEKIPAIVQTKP